MAHRFVISSVIVFALLCDILTPIVIEAVGTADNYSIVFGGLLIGFAIAQLNLISVWAALAPGRRIERLPWSLTLLIFMWYAMILGNILSGNSETKSTSLLGASLLAGYVATQLPLWVVRHLGFRLTPPEQRHDIPVGEQYSLRELIVGTTVLAGLLAIGRWLVPDFSLQAVLQENELHVIVGVLMLFNVVVVLPCVFGPFANRSHLPGMMVAWSVFTFLITFVEIGILFIALGPGPSVGEVFLVFLTINAAQGAAVVVVMGILQSLGFRLIRITSPWA